MTDADITSGANPSVRAAVRLRDNRERAATGLTIVDGARELCLALDAGVVVEEAFVCEPLVRSPDARAAVAALRSRAIPYRTTTVPVFEKLAFGERAEGVVAVIRTPSTSLDALRLPPEPLLLVLEAVEKPGNVGAVLRSADGAGVDAVLLADPRTEPFNPNAIRASIGTAFTVPIASAGGDEIRAFLREQGVRVVAARVDGAVDPWETDLTGPVAIVLGSEAEGLTPAWSGPETIAVRLPMLGTADSLNVSVTGAVLAYEALRQRGRPAGRPG